MTAPAPLPLSSSGPGLVRCVVCKRWRPLHTSANGRDADATCCDRFYLVAPDGEVQVEDLTIKDDGDEPAEEGR